MFYLITYDIVDNKKRNRVSKILEGYGIRVQMSVFECDLNKINFEALMSKLRKVINTDEDSIRVYKICETCKNNIEIIGLGIVYSIPDILII